MCGSLVKMGEVVFVLYCSVSCFGTVKLGALLRMFTGVGVGIGNFIF